MPQEILIVDDEPSIAVPIQFLMEQQGFNVIVAQNGEEALDIIFKCRSCRQGKRAFRYKA